MGLTLRGKCSRRCEQGRKGLSCSCPKSWSYYVEFFVREEGNRRTLSVKGPGAKLKRWRVGCANKGLAREQESIIKAQLLKGQPIVTLNQVPLTFIQYAEGWLVESKSSLAVKTHANYTQLLSLYILPSLGNRELASVKWVDVRALLNEKQQAGLSVNTVRLIRAVTSTILTDAAEEGHIPANPLLGQRRKRRASQKETSDVCPMDWEQKRVFAQQVGRMEADQGLGAAYAMLFRTCIKAGLRPGEARALKPGDIDFVGRRLRVERAATLHGNVKNTKTGETRWVDLSDGLLAELKTYLTLCKAEQFAAGIECLWLFPSHAGTLLDESHVARAFHRVLDKAGLPRFRVYDLRHTFASLLLSSNVPLLYVSQQLGHAKPTITLRYYARWIPSGQVHRVNVLDSETAGNPALTPSATLAEVATALPA
ncbi:MAG: tyrosine-type recombinase/integrase [Nitrospira sp.]